MSFKEIQELLELAKRLYESFKRYNIKNIQSYLKELAEYNSELYEDEKEEVSWLRSVTGFLEPKDKYLFILFSANNRNLKVIKKHYRSNVKKCIRAVEKIIKRLAEVKDHIALIKEIVNTEIAPLLKQWGFRRKGNTFFKPGRIYSKYLRVDPSRTNTFVNAEFVLDFWVFDEKNKKTVTITKPSEFDRIGTLLPKRKKEEPYNFNPYSDIPKEKAKIQEDLEAILKYFDRFN